MNNLEKNIKTLTDNYQIKLRDIRFHPNIRKSYDVVKQYLNTLKSSNNINYIDFINMIIKQYRPSQLIPDTVGSFLFGCFQQTYGDIPMECSPLCAFSISDSTDTTIKCQHQMWIQYIDSGNFRFIKLGKSIDSIAYIFVHLNFTGFTFNEIYNFKEHGILKMQILITKESKHHTIIKMRSINDLPIIEQSEADGSLKITSESYPDDVDNNYSSPSIENEYIYLLIASIIVIIIIINLQK